MKRRLGDHVARSVQEREEMLVRMEAASMAFYMDARKIGVHAFIEFTGLLNEFVAACREAHRNGLDFTQADRHGRGPLALHGHQLDYIAEKLGCIYGEQLKLVVEAECES